MQIVSLSLREWPKRAEARGVAPMTGYMNGAAAQCPRAASAPRGADVAHAAMTASRRCIWQAKATVNETACDAMQSSECPISSSSTTQDRRLRQDLSPLCRCLSSHADNEDRTFGLAECDRTALSIPSYQLRPVA